MDLSFRNCSGSAVEQPLPGEHLSDVCGFIPELATELATQDEEMEEKHQHLLHLKVSNELCRPTYTVACNFFLDFF